MAQQKKARTVDSVFAGLARVGWYRSPARLLVIVVTSVVIVEAALMILLHALVQFPWWLISVVDVAVLVALLISLLYAFLLRPMNLITADITKAEEALGESEERTRDIVETAHDAFISMDAGGVITVWNAQAETLFGWSHSEAIGRGLAATIIPPQSREAHQAGLERFLATGDGPILNERIEITAAHRDGREFPAELAVWAVRVGDSYSFNAFIHDITERKQAEEALRESEERFRALAKASPVGIFRTDADGNCVYVNERWCEIAGLPMEKALREGWEEGLHPDDRERVAADWYRSAKEERPFQSEYRFQRPGGTTTWVIGQATSERDANGNTFGYVGTITDITERKQAEEQVLRLHRQQEAIAGLGLRALRGVSLAALMDESVALLADTLKVEYCKVLELLPEGNAFRLRSGVGWKEGLVGQAMVGAGTDSQAGYTLLSGEPVVVKDLQTETRFSGPALLHDHGVVSGMSVVIEGADQPFGVLGAHTKERRTFNAQDIHALQAIANVLADAIQRRRAEEGLRESEAKFRLLAEQAQDVIFRYRPGPWRCEYISPSVTALTGYEPDQFMADIDVTHRMIHPDDQEAFLEMIRERSTVPLELRWIRRDASVFWTEQRVTPIYDDAGDLVAIEGIARDITERKQAAEALHESEEKFRGLAEALPVAAVVLQGTNISYINSVGAEMLGYSREELLRLSVRDVVHADHIEHIEQRALARLRGETGPPSYDALFVSKSGEERWGRIMSDVTVFNGQPAVLATIADITERKQAEEALRESEERFRRLSEGATEGTGISDKGVILDANPQLARLFGYEVSEIIGLPVSMLVAPESIDLVSRRAASGYDKPYEHMAIRKDGTIFPVEVQGKAMQSGGRTVRVTNIRDITERRQAEEALRESEERFRLLAENAQDVVFRYRFTGPAGYEYISPAVTAMSGYSPEQWYEHPHLGHEIVHPDDRQAFEQMLGELHDGSRELRWIHKNGSVIWTEQRTTPIHDDAGKLVAVEGMIRDITERRRAEEALRLRNAAVDAAANGIVVADREGNIVWVNAAFTALTGYPFDEAVGQNPRLLKSGKQDQPFYKQLWDTVLSGQVWRGEMINRRKDGSFYTEEQTITPVPDERGEITHFIAIKQDVTERKKAEEALRESEERFSTAFHDNPIAAALSRVDDGTLIDVNDAFLRMTGYSQEESIGRTSNDLGMLVEPAVRDRVAEAFRDDEPAQHFATQLRRKTGEIIDVTSTARRIEVQGVPCYLGMIVDVSERERLKKEIEKAREELEGRVQSRLEAGGSYDLTFREMTVLHLVAEGQADKEIAATLGISPLTVSKHVSNILSKMDSHSRTEVGTRALREGLLD